ncbi:MAG: sulfite exporter TauE/SafE family protein [Acidimicrobiales bacterium]
MTGLEIAFVLVAAVLATLVKSITGMGYPLILVPVVALFLDVVDAVVIVGPANLFLNVVLIWQTRTWSRDAHTLTPFLVGAAPGAVVGALILTQIPDGPVRVVLAAVVGVFLVNRFFGRKRTMEHGRASKWAPLVGWLGGLSQGAAGVSGPIISPWFLSLGLERDACVLALATAFGVTGALQIAVLALLGEFTGDEASLGLVLIPIAALVTPVGTRLRRRLPVHLFEMLVLAVLFVSAVSLLVRVF